MMSRLTNLTAFATFASVSFLLLNSTGHADSLTSLSIHADQLATGPLPQEGAMNPKTERVTVIPGKKQDADPDYWMRIEILERLLAASTKKIALEDIKKHSHLAEILQWRHINMDKKNISADKLYKILTAPSAPSGYKRETLTLRSGSNIYIYELSNDDLMALRALLDVTLGFEHYQRLLGLDPNMPESEKARLVQGFNQLRQNDIAMQMSIQENASMARNELEGVLKRGKTPPHNPAIVRPQAFMLDGKFLDFVGSSMANLSQESIDKVLKENRLNIGYLFAETDPTTGLTKTYPVLDKIAQLVGERKVLFVSEKKIPAPPPPQSVVDNIGPYVKSRGNTNEKRGIVDVSGYKVFCDGDNCYVLGRSEDFDPSGNYLPSRKSDPWNGGNRYTNPQYNPWGGESGYFYDDEDDFWWGFDEEGVTGSGTQKGKETSSR